MSDIYEGDPLVTLTEDGADMDIKGGQPKMDQGLVNFINISLFTRKNWFGNFFIKNPDQRPGSDFLVTAEQPITTTGLNDTRLAAEKALKNPIVGKVDSEVTNQFKNNLQVLNKIQPPGSDSQELLLTRNGQNWINQAAKSKESDTITNAVKRSEFEDLIILNPLEDSNLESIFGIDGIEVGSSVTYIPVKNGNGIYSPVAGEGALFDGFNAGTAFTIDFWAMVTRKSRPAPLIGGGGNTDAYCPIMWFMYAGHIGANALQIYIQPYKAGIGRQAYLRFDYAFTDGVPFRVTISINRDGGVLPTDKMKIKINGIEITSFTLSGDDTLPGDWTNMNDFHSMSVGYAGDIPSWFGEAVDTIQVFDSVL